MQKTSEAQLSHFTGNVNTKNIKLTKSTENLITKSQHKIISLQRNKEKINLKKKSRIVIHFLHAAIVEVWQCR